MSQRKNACDARWAAQTGRLRYSHPSAPRHQGFDADPPDPELTTELLLIERPVDAHFGPWRVDGALVKEPARDPEWVEGWKDSYWSADAKQL